MARYLVLLLERDIAGWTMPVYDWVGAMGVPPRRRPSTASQMVVSEGF